MDASTLPTTNADWAEHVTAAIARQRERLRDFLAAQQDRLQGAEMALAAHLQELAGEVARGRDEAQQAQDDAARRKEDLGRQIETLESLRLEFDTRQTQWERLQQRTAEQQEALLEQVRRRQEDLDGRHAELQQRQERLDAAEKQLAEERRTLEAASARAAADIEQAAGLRARLDAERAELAARAERLAAREGETAAQRRRIARDLRAQRAAHLEELERLRAAMPSPEAADCRGLQNELDAAHRRERELAAELEILRSDGEDLRAAKGREKELRGEVESLRAECERLSQTIAQAAAASTAAPGDAADQEDFHRRYEMAMEDLRDLKARNAELQQQLAAAKAAGPAAAPHKGGVLSWEAEKQRILAALESDSGGEKPTKEERLKVEEVVRRTDQLLVDKEREIEDLKKVLDHQSDNLGAVAVGAAALGDLLDKDAIVQEERESLKRMQEEWREKLRKAEIDISMERAKIARERAQIEERLRALESQAATAATEKTDDADKEGKPVRGRWLARLGLKETGEGGKK